MATTLLLPSLSSFTPFFNTKNSKIHFNSSQILIKSNSRTSKIRATQEKTEEIKNSAEDITKKYGLEAGLWKIFSSKEEEDGGEKKKKSKGDEAKELLAKYGGAYLATSITLSLISFSLCYALITAGVDVPALLQKIGISSNETGEKVGTFALAYAAHKAASPIRFPPTVALTPIVAQSVNKGIKSEKKKCHEGARLDIMLTVNGGMTWQDGGGNSV